MKNSDSFVLARRKERRGGLFSGRELVLIDVRLAGAYHELSEAPHGSDSSDRLHVTNVAGSNLVRLAYVYCTANFTESTHVGSEEVTVLQTTATSDQDTAKLAATRTARR